jgi:hypothetical protein
MERTPLSSAAVVSAGYDPDTQQLEIEFKAGRVYVYSDVPPGVFDFLLRTKHKGSYVNRMIHGQYSYREITPAPPEQDLLEALSASLGAAREPKARD